MIRKTKVLGLACVAVLAMSALGASAAQAEVKTTFDMGATSGTIEGAQVGQQVFTTDAGTVTCTTSTLSGSFTAASTTEQTATPTYGGCTAFGFVGATIAMNGCDYLFKGTTTKAPEPAETLATVDIICPKEKEITVTAFTCVVHVEPQTNLEHIKFVNNKTKTPDDVDAEATLTKIKYTPTSGCPGEFTPGKTTEDGTFNGKATVKAFDTSKVQTTLTATP